MKDVDVIVVSEIKTAYPFSVPGYVTIRSALIEGESHRGGVAVLVSDRMSSLIVDIDKRKDQVWFRVSSMREHLFGAVYVSPRDSPYFDVASLGVIQEKCKDEDHVVVLGDFNARMPNLNQLYSCHVSNMSYSNNPDTRSNANGKDLTDICQCVKLFPINHLHIDGLVCDGCFTHRKGDQWMSQIDWALCSERVLTEIENFTIDQSPVYMTDHAALFLTLQCSASLSPTLYDRAKRLNQEENGRSRPPIRMKVHNIEPSQFVNSISSTNLDSMQPENMCEKITESLYSACITSRKKGRNPGTVTNVTCSHDRWHKLVSSGNSKQIWQAIDWRGKFSSINNSELETPSDQDFIEHFDKLFNQTVESESETNMVTSNDTDTYIPILDDEITTDEVERHVNKLDSQKAAGHDGIPPGILKLVIPQWIVLITTLFNLVFFGAIPFPKDWAISRVFTIFKKGAKMNPNNYRGISVVNCLPKLYDSILNTRFTQWFQPDREQGGSQKGMSCAEHITTIRLLIDIAKKSRQSLYLLFLDFEKAYDRVNRQLLFKLLRQSGCGSTFLNAIKSMYASTKGLIGQECFKSNIGVRQGASTSGSLFNFYVNRIIRCLGECQPDGFLGSLHCLLYMDDTVLMSTTKAGIENKFKMLENELKLLNMKCHPAKCKLLTVNPRGEANISIDGVTVCHTNSYMYLGTPITNSLKQDIQEHIDSKKSHEQKFYSFLSKNLDAPFHIKKTVWEACFSTTYLYGCQSWLSNGLKCISKPYMSTLKAMLGVRTQTSNDIVLVEVGMPDAMTYVQAMQKKFWMKLCRRSNFAESVIKEVLDIAGNFNAPMYRASSSSCPF